MVRRDEPLVTLPGSGPCNGYHRVQRIVHVHGDDPTPPWPEGGHPVRAVRLRGRVGVPDGHASAHPGSAHGSLAT